MSSLDPGEEDDEFVDASKLVSADLVLRDLIAHDVAA